MLLKCGQAPKSVGYDKYRGDGIGPEERLHLLGMHVNVMERVNACPSLPEACSLYTYVCWRMRLWCIMPRHSLAPDCGRACFRLLPFCHP